MEITAAEYRGSRSSGTQSVHYNCPRCDCLLVTFVNEIQNGDKCPDCHSPLTFSAEIKQLVQNKCSEEIKAEQMALEITRNDQQRRLENREKILALFKKRAPIISIAAAGVVIWGAFIFTGFTFREEISGAIFAGTQSVADSIPSLPTNPVRNWVAKKTVEIGLGTATIYDYGENEINSLRLDCKNGLVIEINWKRNVLSDFGYDVDEPVVNKSYNRLAVMMAAKGVIASYLRGEYD